MEQMVKNSLVELLDNEIVSNLVDELYINQLFPCERVASLRIGSYSFSQDKDKNTAKKEAWDLFRSLNYQIWGINPDIMIPMGYHKEIFYQRDKNGEISLRINNVEDIYEIISRQDERGGIWEGEGSREIGSRTLSKEEMESEKFDENIPQNYDLEKEIKSEFIRRIRQNINSNLKSYGIFLEYMTYMKNIPMPESVKGENFSEIAEFYKLSQNYVKNYAHLYKDLYSQVYPQKNESSNDLSFFLKDEDHQKLYFDSFDENYFKKKLKEKVRSNRIENIKTGVGCLGCLGSIVFSPLILLGLGVYAGIKHYNGSK